VRYLSVSIGHVLLSAFVQAAVPIAVPAQTVVAVGQTTARQYLESAPTPMYPRIAQAINVTGVVNVDVTIGPDGRVVRAFALGGPPMLLAAAETGVRAWRFRPTAAADTRWTGRGLLVILAV
jgi:outer membrane biosynthesis protein TonB